MKISESTYLLKNVAGFFTDSGDRAISQLAANRNTFSCSHCQLPVPMGLIIYGQKEQFCCNGCKMVYEILHDGGLEEYYALCHNWNSQPTAPQADTYTHYETFDGSDFHAKYVKRLSLELSETRLLLEGVHCAACVWLLEKLPSLLPGVLSARCHLLDGSLLLQWNPKQVPLSSIIQLITRLGYISHPFSIDKKQEVVQAETHRQLFHLAIAGACAANNMLIAIAIYGGYFGYMTEEHALFLRISSMVLGIVSLLGPGRTFFTGALRALRTRVPHMDISLALGLAAGGILGIYNTLTNTGEIFFDSLSMLVFVLLIGRFLQYRQQRNAARSVDLLQSLIPHTTHKVKPDGSLQCVLVDAIRPGDLLEMRAGDLIPADGQIQTGDTTINLAMLTGESNAVAAHAGDCVYAGTMNISQNFRMVVHCVGLDTRVGLVLSRVDLGTLNKVPIVQLANRVSGYFLLLVLILGLVSFLIWTQYSFREAINNFIALLIVACPCALGLATPLTIALGQGRAAKQSILVRSGDVFERLNTPGMIWLDKTGTVTTGRPRLVHWVGDKSAQLAVYTLEKHVTHPIANVFVDHFRSQFESILTPEVIHLHFSPGYGVKGVIDGSHWMIGNRAFLKQHQVNFSEENSWQVTKYLQKGLTPHYIACNGNLVALAILGDKLHADAKTSIQELAHLGWKVGLLSGDHAEIALRVGTELGIPKELIYGEVTPEGKEQIIRESSERETTIMVGDGINDACALVVATVGVAVHGGAEVSLKAAPVYLGKSGVKPLVELLNGSRQTILAVRNGIILSLVYNTLAVGLATMGMINPLVAAILMPVSSVSVIILAMAQPSFRSQ